MIRRITAILLTMLLMMSQMAWAEETSIVLEDQRKLTVGNTTQMKGDFFTELWGNATSDIDVRELIHGYNLVQWDGEQGEFNFDPTVVTGVATVENEYGDKSYILVLAEDLKYSDGTPITAWDYAFSYLFQIDPEIEKIGGKPIRKEHLLGYEAYLKGELPYLQGVHVTSDYTIVVTLDGEFLPFFYEIGLLLCNPYPIHVITPGVEVRDDGYGCYLANADGSQEPIFTAALLEKTVNDPKTGYRSHPSVVSGAYVLTDWDGTTAKFAANPYYKGNVKGEQAIIPTLEYTKAENETMLDQMESGKLDILNKVTRSDAILDGLTLSGSSDDYQMKSYPRLGLSYISFACEKPTVSETAVRQAIAYCMDRDAILNEYTSSFGMRVDGYYGVGQWMYGLINGTVEPPVEDPETSGASEAEYEAELAEWEALNLDELNEYGVDQEKAAALLDEAGWSLNAEGIREKEGTALDLLMYYPAGNEIVTSLENHWAVYLKEVGIQLRMEPLEMSELLQKYYKNDEREMDMVFLASNFDIVFDPFVNFRTDAAGEPNWSYTNHTDGELYRLADEMRKTEPGAVLEYLQKWIKFQERFNEQLPMLPIYSNMYFDFYPGDLQNYDVNEEATWSQAIVGAYIGEEPAEEEDSGDVLFDE